MHFVLVVLHIVSRVTESREKCLENQNDDGKSFKIMLLKCYL